ncbi:MAG: hypothetical protein KatS3mg131_2608 [Candidatus Tectimicrobiota bacterium]|nr:MAG: hypothetical protein KatS3mg131_2608 [Candidatus Tectomicrobia bacterium]
MVTRVVKELLQASGLFREVVAAADVRLPAWVLSGEVLRFDEVRDAAGTHAECWLRVALHRARDERFLWSAVLRGRRPPGRRNPGGAGAGDEPCRAAGGARPHCPPGAARLATGARIGYR